MADGATSAAARPLDDIAITLVSVAIGEPYESSLKKMRATAAAAGFNRTLLWTRKEFLADPAAIKYSAALEQMQRGHRQRKKRHPFDRPYCGSFKPFVLMRAMLESREGDYVMWADASKYHDARYIGVSVRDAVAALTGRTTPPRPPKAEISTAYAETPWFQRRQARPRRTARSAFGVIHCHGVDCDSQLFMANYYRWSVNSRTLRTYNDSVDDKVRGRRPHIMNANILLENNVESRRVIGAWLDAAVTKPDVFCSSGPQEQAVFTLMAQAARVPMVNACPYLRLKGWNTCQDLTKSSTWFLKMLASGAFEVVAADELDAELVADHQLLHTRWQAQHPDVKIHPFEAGARKAAATPTGTTVASSKGRRQGQGRVHGSRLL